MTESTYSVFDVIWNTCDVYPNASKSIEKCSDVAVRTLFNLWSYADFWAFGVGTINLNQSF